MKIYFSYKQKVITLPVNPESIEVSWEGSNEKVSVVKLGEINIKKKPKLKSFAIESFLPSDDNPQKYVNYFSKIHKGNKPVTVLITDIDFNMLVLIDTFTYSFRAGEERDIYYTLEFSEWVDYSPKKVIKTKTAKKTKTPPARKDDKKEPPKTHQVKYGDCLWNIAKKYTGKGSNWNELYQLNKKIIGSNPNRLMPDKKGKFPMLQLPKGW